MNRCQSLSDRVLDDFCAIALPPLRHEAIAHTLATAHAARMLGLHRQMDSEACVSAALLHDIALYTQNCPHSLHAEKSATIAPSYLNDAGFLPHEIQTICAAIRCHSHKERIDDPLSELLKDADVLGRYLQTAEVPSDPRRHERLILAMKELCLL